MFIDYHNFFESANVIKATRVIIRDGHNNAIALFLDNANGTIEYYCAGDSDFTEILGKYGIEAPVVKNLIIGE